MINKSLLRLSRALILAVLVLGCGLFQMSMLSQPVLADPVSILHSGISAPRTEMPPDIQRILDRGTLVVALLDHDNPPFFMGEAKALAGLDIKIAQGLANALEVD